MARFYFDFRENGSSTEDEEGHDLLDVGAAEREAVRAAAEIALDRFSEGTLRSVTVDVRDRNGDHMLSATVSLNVTSGVAHPRAGKERSRSDDEGQGAGSP
jgi:hypothetical protein